MKTAFYEGLNQRTFAMQYYPHKEYFEPSSKNHRWYGYTERFENYRNVFFTFFPLTFETHQLKNWRMEIKQKTSKSRLYIHVHNKKNFGFRVRLPGKVYSSIEQIFDALAEASRQGLSVQLSQMSVTNVVEVPYKVKVEVTKLVEVPQENSFETAMQRERERILTEIGDYRGTPVVLPDNVIDFSEYLQEPKPVVPTEQAYQELLKKMASNA